MEKPGTQEVQKTKKLDKLEVKQRLLTVKKLPSQPQVVREIIKLWRNPNVSMAEYERIISNDPGLTSEVLKIVNSPYYGLKSKVTNLRIALTMLGLVEIYRIVANVNFYKVFRSMFNRLSYDFSVFWKHSQMTANIAHYLANNFIPEHTAEAHLVGLLHDVGKLVMEQFFNDEWQELMLRLDQYKKENVAVEEEIYGLNHCEIGAILLIRWNIPKEIVIPVRYHHTPLEAPEHQKLALVSYFAEKIATYRMSEYDQHMIQEYFSEDKMWQTLSNKYPELNLLNSPEKLNEINLTPF